MSYCSNCGAEIPEGTKFCPKCGASLKPAGKKPEYQGTPERQKQEDFDQHRSSQSAGGNPSGEQGHGQAIGSLVCGIVGVVCWFFGYGSILAIVLGIIGLVLAGNAKKTGNQEGIRTAGFVLSLIGLIGGIIVFFYLVIVLAFVGATVQGAFHLLQ